jgi:protoporphyrinogen oxidase
MPIDSFLKIFKNYKFKIDKFNLNFRNTILVYSKIKQSNLFEDQWIYIQDEKIKAGRITNFNNWIPELINNEKGSLLANEYWAYDDDELWNMSDGDLKYICYSDLKACGFLDDKKDIIDFKIIRVPKCYPVYSGDYKNSLLEIQDFLKSYKNLSLIGRYGSFKYNNQDHSILMGYLCSRNILLDEENNLWEINSDYKYHESSRISESGLIVN